MTDMTAVVESLVPRLVLDKLRDTGQERTNWKFIVVETAEALHLVAGPVDDYPYHANLLAQFCDRKEIPASWVKKPDFVEIFDPEVRIRGGGHLRIDFTRHEMKFYGRSTAYGAYKPDDIDRAAASDPFFAGFKVIVRRT